MDPNLENIIHANRFAIKHGSIHKVCNQAEDYLTYVLGHNQEAIKKELTEFVSVVKTTRRKSRGKKETKAHTQHQQRVDTPTPC